MRAGTTPQGASRSAMKESPRGQGSQHRLASDSPLQDLWEQFSSQDAEHSASGTDSSGEDSQGDPLGQSMETVLMEDEEDEEEEVVEVVVPDSPPWTTSQPQRSASPAATDDMPSTSAEHRIWLSRARSATYTTNSTMARFPTSPSARTTPAGAERLSGTAVRMPSPAKRGRKVSSYVWGHFKHTSKFTVVCKHCGQDVRLGKEGGCTRVGTTSMHQHMSVHHPLLLPKKILPKPSARLSSALTFKALLAVPTATSPAAGVHTLSPLNQHKTVGKKQPWNPSDPLAMEHNQWLAEFLAKSMQPFSLVDEPAFREFLHRCFPQWIVPRRIYFSASAVPALAASIKVAVEEKLKVCIGGTVHLTAAVWTSSHVQDFMSVTGHWMAHDQAGRLVCYKALLDMSGFGQAHTAWTVGQKLQSVLKDWLSPLGIKPSNVASDNAAVIVEALDDAGLPHIPCAVHCLDLVVKGWLAKCHKDLSTTLETVRAICSHFQHSASAQAQLRDIQRRKNVPRQQLLRDVATQWKTTLRMLERLNEQRRAVTVCVEGIAELHLDVLKWDVIVDMISLLGPFEEAIRMLSLDSATLGQVLPMLRLIEALLQDVCLAAWDGTPSYSVSRALLFRFQTCWHLSAIRENIVYLTASFLDPRFRDTFHTYFGGPKGQLQRKLKEVEAYVLEETAEAYTKEFGAGKADAEEEPHPLSATQPGPGTSLQPTTSMHSAQDWWVRNANRVGITRPAMQQQQAQHQCSQAANITRQELEAYWGG